MSADQSADRVPAHTPVVTEADRDKARGYTRKFFETMLLASQSDVARAIADTRAPLEARNAELERENLAIVQAGGRMIVSEAAQLALIKQLEREKAGLAAALLWYADKSNYPDRMVEGAQGTSIIQDVGFNARKALSSHGAASALAAFEARVRAEERSKALEEAAIAIRRIRYPSGTIELAVEAIRALKPATEAQERSKRSNEAGVAGEVAAERDRQRAREHWTIEHDDGHTLGELARAAICYADPLNEGRENPPAKWPWESRWWKPKDRRRDLIRAAALIVAEIERLDRRALKPATEAQHGDGA